MAYPCCSLSDSISKRGSGCEDACVPQATSPLLEESLAHLYVCGVELPSSSSFISIMLSDFPAQFLEPSGAQHVALMFR